MTTYNVGPINSNPFQRSNYTVTQADPTDVFAFEITDAKDINVSMDSLSGFLGNTNLSLYKDVNGNGALDNSDQLITKGVDSALGGGRPEGINVTATSGKYLAQVSRGYGFSTGSSSPFSYNFKLSATQTNTPSNLTPSEIQVGEVNRYTELNGKLDRTNTADVYAFSTYAADGMTVRLDGLAGNANIRLIKDSNNNGLVDSGEVLKTSTNFGSASEMIDFAGSGNFLLQVHKGAQLVGPGSTDYTLRFSPEFIH